MSEPKRSFLQLTQRMCRVLTLFALPRAVMHGEIGCVLVSEGREGERGRGGEGERNGGSAGGGKIKREWERGRGRQRVERQRETEGGEGDMEGRRGREGGTHTTPHHKAHTPHGH